MDIGARLKEARVSKGLSLEELQEMTKIQKRYLSAIEEGKFEILPGKFYAKAFIKEYANAVGIDPNELLEEHQEDMPNTVTEEPSTIEYSRMERSRKGNTEKSSKLFSMFPTIIVVLLIIGIIFVIWFFNGGIGSDNRADGEDVLDDTEIIINNPDEVDEDTEEKVVDEEKEDVNTEDIQGDEKGVQEDEEDIDQDKEDDSDIEFTVLEEGTGTSPESTLELNKSLEEITLTFETESRTWLDVTKDENETLFSSTLEAENSPLELDLTGTSRIFLNIGDASDLKIKINGVELEYPVDPTEVVHQRLWIHIPDEIE